MQLNPARGRKQEHKLRSMESCHGFMQLNPARGRKRGVLAGDMPAWREVYAAQPREGTET